MNNKKTYSLPEIAHLGVEIVLHMRATGAVTWDTWYAYAVTPIAARYFAVLKANPALAPMF